MVDTVQREKVIFVLIVWSGPAPDSRNQLGRTPLKARISIICPFVILPRSVEAVF
jgi:hypothetical protein